MRAVVLATRFVLELCLFAAFALWGWWAGGGGLSGTILAVVTAGVGAITWGHGVGPKIGSEAA